MRANVFLSVLFLSGRRPAMDVLEGFERLVASDEKDVEFEVGRSISGDVECHQ